MATAGHRSPKLTAVLVGDDPASAIYVRTTTRTCEGLGIDSETIELPENVSTKDLIGYIDERNTNKGVDGILVQLPLPSGVDTEAVLDNIDPRKDVDGLHPHNVGLLVQGRPRFVPATPGGIMQMLDRRGIEIEGANAVIIGRSEIVGKPMASLLMHRNATVTVCHSRTRDLPAVCRSADILVVAVGRDAMVTKDFVKSGATVIDVGINRVEAPEKGLKEDGTPKTKLVGDVDFAEAVEVAGAITPVPGGVGPMTIACLLRNTLVAACRQAGIEPPAI